MNDLLGLYHMFRPSFAKCYVPEVVEQFVEKLPENVREEGKNKFNDGFYEMACMSILKYIEEVKNNKFPNDEYSYPITEEELKLLKQSPKWKY